MSMRGSYAYSFDRETFHGNYKTRDEAFRAALKRDDLVGPDLVVWVGQRAGGDPQTAGHAREVIATMIRRARAAVGDDARSWLRGVTPEQIQDLDGALETTINRWLQNHKLTPQFDKITGISEHPLPNTPQVREQQDAPATEVQTLGSERDWR